MELKVLQPKKHFKQLVLAGRREDGRSLTDLRDIKIETNVVKSTFASSRIKWGETSIICCLTCDKNDSLVEKPFKRKIQVKIDLPPIAIGRNQLPTHLAQLATRKINTILDEIDIVSMQNDDTNIEAEIICLSYDGALVAASLLAVLVSLDASKPPGLPKILENPPICIPFCFIEDYLIVDPTLEEEAVASATLSVCLLMKTCDICLVEKTGGKPLPDSKFMQCLTQAEKLIGTLRASLLSHI